ncbi:energy transducer TonB [Flavobacterium sp. HXWNR69]|uniref:Energy transducer TonB n=1 Tax=Flavobacterium fragile TaxID=2949085 RepID=A0ABT0TIK1_9FLAO|nr:energy transducer TonB [Flavobacterium sp. HXWNR69]MCL9770801.1 energy transducer TonB [Flavobacterium sp. HXWNR69]
MRRKGNLLELLTEYVPLSLLLTVLLTVLFFVLYKQLQKSDIPDERRSFILSTYSFLSIVLILFSIRFWPPSNIKELIIAQGGGGGGIEVNFGDSDLGSGDNFTSEVLDVTNHKVIASSESVSAEDIITQDNTDDIPSVIKTPSKEKTNEVVKKEVKPSESKVDPVKKNSALANILNGKNKGGDGDDNVAGNKGDKKGSLSSSDYYGDGGSGGGSGGGNGKGVGTGDGDGYGPGSGNGSGGGIGYSLGNRKALVKPAPKYVCNETGKVVVEVQVDKTGRTISAVAGVKGTTNTAKCLLDQAKIAALNTKWQASESAPETQRGNIIYNFTISE